MGHVQLCLSFQQILIELPGVELLLVELGQQVLNALLGALLDQYPQVIVIALDLLDLLTVLLDLGGTLLLFDFLPVYDTLSVRSGRSPGDASGRAAPSSACPTA